MPLRAPQVIACIKSLILFMAVLYPIVWLYQFVSLFTHCRTLGHLQFLAIINNVAKNINVNVWTEIFVSLGWVLSSAIVKSFGIYERFKCIFPLIFPLSSCFLPYEPSFLNNTISVFPRRMWVFHNRSTVLTMIGDYVHHIVDMKWCCLVFLSRFPKLFGIISDRAITHIYKVNYSLL